MRRESACFSTLQMLDATAGRFSSTFFSIASKTGCRKQQQTRYCQCGRYCPLSACQQLSLCQSSRCSLHAAVQVRWHPYQLMPDAPQEGVNKLEMYNAKFGAARVASMMPMMAKVRRWAGESPLLAASWVEVQRFKLRQQP